MRYRELGKTGLLVSEIGMVCEKRCPFEVPIIENMKKAQRIFGK